MFCRYASKLPMHFKWVIKTYVKRDAILKNFSIFLWACYMHETKIAQKYFDCHLRQSEWNIKFLKSSTKLHVMKLKNFYGPILTRIKYYVCVKMDPFWGILFINFIPFDVYLQKHIPFDVCIFYFFKKMDKKMLIFSFF